jgi:hypothetical protein
MEVTEKEQALARQTKEDSKKSQSTGLDPQYKMVQWTDPATGKERIGHDPVHYADGDGAPVTCTLPSDERYTFYTRELPAWKVPLGHKQPLLVKTFTFR